MNIYTQTGLAGLLGTALSVLVVLRSQTNKADKANVLYPWNSFLKRDLILNIIGSALTLGLGWLALGPAVEAYPKIFTPLRSIAIFSTIGYVGSAIASSFFSYVNNRITKAIDQKTDIADKVTQNTDIADQIMQTGPTFKTAAPKITKAE